MIRILQLKLPVLHTEEELKEKILHTLRIRPEELKSWKIVRRSIDARKKDALCFVYQIDVETPKEKRILSKSKHNEIMSTNTKGYRFPKPGSEELAQRPVVIGSGPAGGGVERRGLGHAPSFDRLPNSTMTAISIVTSASTTPIAEARPNCERAKAVS